MTDYFLLLGGFVLLVLGGELLVRGAVQTAERLGMSPLLIGLTLVGFGTSTPELVTSVQASLAGSPGIAVGNIVGSNISNILLILGISAMISPMAVGSQALMRDGGVVLFSAMLFAVIGFSMPLNGPVGTVLLLGLASYLFYAYRQEMANAPAGHTSAFDKAEAFEGAHTAPLREATNPDVIDGKQQTRGILLPIGLAVIGLLVVVLGGKLLVDGATGIARSAGISETVIGLTIVAVGTSLPELVTSVIAALRKHGDVALGNILGSNIYNVLGIGGVTAIASPTVMPAQIVEFDNLVMVAASILLIVFARTGIRIGRLEGVVLLTSYVAYIYYIWPK